MLAHNKGTIQGRIRYGCPSSACLERSGRVRRRHRNDAGAVCAGAGAVQARPAHRQDRPAGAGRYPDGTGHPHLPEGEGQRARGPQDRVHLRRHRRQSGRRPHQGAGADRARQGQRHPRAARRLRTAGDHQLRARQRDAADQSRGGGRRHPARGQSVRDPSLGDVGAVLSRHGRLRGEGFEIPPRGADLGGLRVRLRADGRLPARVRGQWRARA